MEGMRGKFEITEGPRTKDEMEHLVKTGGKVRLEVTERQGGMMISSLFREAIIESIVPLKSGEAHLKGQIPKAGPGPSRSSPRRTSTAHGLLLDKSPWTMSMGL